MKEISLQDLLNMADAAAHDGIGELWNQKTIHYLVIFTSEDEDFEIIGAGPTLPCPTLEEAARHTVPGKKPEFYVKCPGALAGRLQPKLAPAHLGMHPPAPRPGTRPPQPASTPTPILKGRTSVPFARPQLKLNPKPADATSSISEPAVHSSSPAAAEIPAGLAQREMLVKQREQELALLAENLKAREAALREREAAIAAMEERLLHPPTQN